jgi:hypothetical protein
MQDRARPRLIQRAARTGYGEPVWAVELVNRADGAPEGMLVIGIETGANYGWHAVSPDLLSDAGEAHLPAATLGTAPGAAPRAR